MKTKRHHPALPKHKGNYSINPDLERELRILAAEKNERNFSAIVAEAFEFYLRAHGKQVGSASSTS